jgi:glutamyl-tRNA reductase
VATVGVREAVILSTCNRAEIYAVFAGAPDVARLAGFLAEDRGVEPGALGSTLALRTGGDAVQHLFRVAVFGLDPGQLQTTGDGMYGKKG